MTEIDPATGLPIRIFRIQQAAFKLPPDRVREWPKRDAVESIRRQVFARTGGECEFCAKRITWDSMHMHEQQHKSLGGEVSLENSVGLCARCHLDVEHGDRKWGGRR